MYGLYLMSLRGFNLDFKMTSQNKKHKNPEVVLLDCSQDKNNALWQNMNISLKSLFSSK